MTKRKLRINPEFKDLYPEIISHTLYSHDEENFRITKNFIIHHSSFLSGFTRITVDEEHVEEAIHVRKVSLYESLNHRREHGSNIGDMDYLIYEHNHILSDDILLNDDSNFIEVEPVIGTKRLVTSQMIGTIISPDIRHKMILKSFQEEDLTPETNESIEADKSMVNPNAAIESPLSLQESITFKARYTFSDHIDVNPINSIDLISIGENEEIPYREPRIFWNPPESKFLNLKKDYLTQEILNRYAMFDRPRSGQSNVIIDSFVPRVLFSAKFNLSRAREMMGATNSFMAISPWFANIFGVKELEMEEKCKILGYTKRDISELFKKAKANKYSIVFVGFGGTGVNTICNLEAMSKMVNAINTFENSYVYEPEDAEVSNLLRYPINPLEIAPSENMDSSKLRLLGDKLKRLTRVEHHSFREFYDPENGIGHERTLVQDVKDNLFEEDDSIHTEEKQYEIKAKDNYIMFGAPGIRTREKLTKYGHFIAGTHANRNSTLVLNPVQDSSMQVESYGVLQLLIFEMNMLRLSIGLLEALGRKDIDLKQERTELMKYEFDGIPKLKTNRNYTFQLEHSGSISTDEEANLDV